MLMFEYSPFQKNCNQLLVFYDYNGSCLGAGASKGLKLFSPKKGKARVMLLVVMKAEKKGFSKIHILSITIEVINAINGNMDWSINSIVVDILVTSSNFINVESSYILRKHNSLVHCLGNLSFTSRADFE